MSRRVGAVLLVIGGVLDAVQFGLVGVASPVLPTPVALGVTVGPTACIGAGLILIAVSFRGRGRVPLMAAGVLELLTVVVNGVQVVAHSSPLGPVPSGLAGAAAFAAVILAAALLLSDPSQRGPARWGMAIPAACTVLFLVSLFAPPLARAGIVLLPGIGVGFAIVGVLLLRRAQPHPAQVQPAEG